MIFKPKPFLTQTGESNGPCVLLPHSFDSLLNVVEKEDGDQGRVDAGAPGLQHPASRPVHDHGQDSLEVRFPPWSDPRKERRFVSREIPG